MGSKFDDKVKQLELGLDIKKPVKGVDPEYAKYQFDKIRQMLNVVSDTPGIQPSVSAVSVKQPDLFKKTLMQQFEDELKRLDAENKTDK